MCTMKNSGVEWIGEIPENWEISRFKYLYLINKAKLPKALFETQDCGMQVYMSMDYIRNPDNCWPQYAIDGSFCAKDDALLLWDGSNAGEIIHIHPEGYAPSTTAILTLIKDIDKGFGVYALKFLEQQIRKNVNGMGVPHVDGAFLRNLPFILPSVAEQAQIADFLDGKCVEIDGLVGDIQEQIDVLEQYKKSVITEVVTRGLDPDVPMKDSGIEWVGMVPEHWDTPKVLYVLNQPITDGPHVTPELFDDGIPFVSAEAVSCGNGRIDFNHIRGYVSEDFYNECCKKYIPQMNDIYMIKSGATTGKVAIVDTDMVFTIWSPLAVFRCNARKMMPKFMFYCLQSTYFQNQVQDGWTFGTQQNIGMRTLEQLRICKPPIGEQQIISDYLYMKCAEIDGLISDKKGQIEVLEEYKKSLIYEYVTGKKEVPGE